MLKAIFTPLLVFCMLLVHAAPSSAIKLDAIYDKHNSAVILHFQLLRPGIKQYIIERSSNDSGWNELVSGDFTTSDNGRIFTYNDLLQNGKYAYRLKYIMNDNEAEYSSTVEMNAFKMNNWAIYPVPLNRDLLTLQYKGKEKNKGVININIYSASGRLATRLRYSSLTTNVQIPLDNLCRGIYTMQITVEKQMVWQSDFVK